MTIPPPKLDPRTHAERVQQLITLAEYYTRHQDESGEHLGWQQQPKPDLGEALIRIYSRLMGVVQTRLNRSLDKNFLAFLDLIGARILPPQPARVPLTFSLIEDAPEDGFVPRYTQIAAVPEPDETAEVVFETTRNLVVTRSQLQSVIVWDQATQRWCDRTSIALGTVKTPFPAFSLSAPRTLYINCGELPAPDTSAIITLSLTTFEATRLALADDWRWSVWTGDQWRSLERLPSLEEPQGEPQNEPQPPTEFTVSLPTFASELRDIDGIEGHWLRLQPVNSSLVLPDIQHVQLHITTTQQATNLPLDQAVFNLNEIDLSKDFYPLGEQPAFNDTLYLASRSGFSAPNSQVTLNLTPTAPYPVEDKTEPTPQDVGFQWEVWNGETWQNVPATGIPSDPPPADPLQGTFELTLPDVIAETTVNDESNYWLRGRLVAGNYGRAPTFYYQEVGAGDEKRMELRQDAGTGYAPPVLKSITLTFSHNKSITRDVEFRQMLAADMPMHRVVTAPELGDRPALYLKFDRPFSNRAIALYLQVIPPAADDFEHFDPVAESAQLVWEYTSPTGWQRLPVEDGTQGLTERGVVEFVGPTDFEARSLFGQSGFWLRLRWQQGDFRIPPQLQQILPNTVWGLQAVHLTHESLGSSTGNPSQTFTTLQAPVLPGQQLDVRESTLAAPQTQAASPQPAAGTTIPLPTNTSEPQEATWVRWHQVPDFYTSTPEDRHYTLDAITGEVRFGDGQRGQIPPEGLNNIRMTFYQAGGGAQGNRAATTITELRTALSFIKQVTNLEPATGGAAQENLDRVKERGPKQIRHRQRAVTLQDFEDLAYEASADVARVRAIAPDTQPQFDAVWNPLDDSLWIEPDSSVDANSPHMERSNGQVMVLVVPQSGDRQPVPTLGLLDRVQTYLTQRASPLLAVEVRSPRWQEISVTTTIVPTSNDRIDALRLEIQSQLTAFLHPLTGGTDNQGWAFGQHPYRSLFYQLLETIPSVNHVRSLRVDGLRDRLPPDTLIYSGSHTIQINPPT